MRRTTLPVAFVLAALLGILAAAPAAAATTGTLCGQVTAFTAPTATDGSITIDGTVEAIDSSAVIEADTIAVLTTVAAAGATTCLEITADGDGVIVALDIAAQAEICGEVTLDTSTGVYSVGGVDLPAALVSADADLEALLDAAAAGGASVCLDVTISGTTGLITTASVNATLDLCGQATLDADSVAIAGVDVPLSLLDAEALAVLELAVDAGADVCLQVVVDDTDLVQANLSADIELCGEVTLEADGSATIDGVTIDAALLDAGAEALLELAASADGTACASIVAVSSGGDTSVTVGVTVEVCAEVTAIGDGTITLDGVTLGFAGAADADIEVGDVVCVAAATGPTGDPIVTDIDTEEGAAPDDDDAAAPDDDDPVLPDTATRGPVDPVGIGAVLLVLAAMTASSLRLSGSRSAR